MIQPLLVGLKVCREVIIDKASDYITLVNCIREIRVADAPTPPDDYTVCCVLGSGRGPTELTLEVSEVSDLSASDELLSHSWSITLNHLEQSWVYMNLRSFSFPSFGQFEFLLLVNGEWFADCTIYVLEGERR